jgi:predicted MPP superfamily phosphohydrolase
MNVIRNFSRAEYWWERAQAALTPTDWPARLASRLGVRETAVRWDVDLAITKPLGTAPSLRIGFASDLHAGPTTPLPLIEHACSLLAAAHPDVILLGGDFISIRPEYADRLLGPLTALRAPLGVFAVFGNHDHWTALARVAGVLERAGIQLLVNRSERLPVPFERTLLVGLDDHTSGHPDATGPRWDGALATVLLMHQPSGLIDAAGRPFDLALAGHTHGGHIVLGGLAPVAPTGALSRRFRVGRFPLSSGATLLVSRGVGHGALPFRVGAPSEVVVCTLRGADAGVLAADRRIGERRRAPG